VLRYFFHITHVTLEHRLEPTESTRSSRARVPGAGLLTASLDQMNLGSRLEGLNRAYGTEILIVENTARLVERSFPFREIDTVWVVGRV
jgi:hypothetical protein